MKFFWNVNIDSRTCKTLKCYWQFVKSNWQFLHQLATILGPVIIIIIIIKSYYGAPQPVLRASYNTNYKLKEA